jgi:hypothetical protein
MVNWISKRTLIIQVILASSSVDILASLDDGVGVLSDTSDHGWPRKSTHACRIDISFFEVERFSRHSFVR